MKIRRIRGCTGRELHTRADSAPADGADASTDGAPSAAAIVAAAGDAAVGDAAAGPVDLGRAMERLSAALSAPYYLVARYDPNTDDPAELILASSFPLEWAMTYARERYDRADPTLRYIARVDRPFRWSEAIAAMEPEGDRRGETVDRARRAAGYDDGWTFPVASRRGLIGGAVLSGPGPYDWSAETVAATWGAVQALWWGGTGGEPDVLPHATRREREVLTLLAEGLVSRAIGERMGISATTVDWHIAQLSEKLGARNRQHLVAIAMRSGLVA